MLRLDQECWENVCVKDLVLEERYWIEKFVAFWVLIAD